MRPRTIYALAVIGVALYAFPGLVSYDSLFQLDEARRWDLGLAHPPMMSALWRICELVIAGPFGMLMLQTCALVAGLRVIFQTRPWLVLAITWFPPVLVVMGVIWKDAQMAGYLVLGIALLAQRRRGLATVVLIVASALRHNAPAATLVPVVALWVEAAVPAWRRYLIGFAAWCAITAASLGATHLLVNRFDDHGFGDIIAVTDIQGIVRWAPPMTDAELRDVLAGTNLHVDHDIQHELAAHYDPRNYLEFAEHPQPLELSTTPEQREAVGRAWRRLVLDHPGAYLHHHWDTFRRVLLVHAPARPPAIVTTDDISNPIASSAIQRAAFWLVGAISPLWYVPFIYFAVGLVVLGLARTRLEVAVLGSGLVYELGLFPAAMTADYRYSHWLILAVTIGVALVMLRRARIAAVIQSRP